MAWAKLDDQFFNHPKMRAAGKNGRALFIAGMCSVAANLTDGFIPATDLQLLAAQAEVPGRATAARLVEVNAWETVPGGWQIHDYLDWNPTAEEVREKRRKRAEAGRIGGKKSKPPGSKSEAKPEAFASANGEANAKQNGTPSPSPSPSLSGSSSSSSSISLPVGAERPQAVIDAIAWTVDAKLANVDRSKIGNWLAYRATSISNAWTEHGPALVRIHDEHPDLDGEQLADEYDLLTMLGGVA